MTDRLLQTDAVALALAGAALRRAAHRLPCPEAAAFVRKLALAVTCYSGPDLVEGHRQAVADLLTDAKGAS